MGGFLLSSFQYDRLREVVQTKGKYPFALLLSGILEEFRLFGVFIVAGIIFMIIGILVPFPLFVFLGGIPTVFFLYLCVSSSMKTISELRKAVNEDQFYEIIEAERHSEKGNFFSYYDRTSRTLERVIEGKPCVPPSPDSVGDEPDDASWAVSPSETENAPGGWLTKIFGILFVIASVYIAATGISYYLQQLDQQDWVVRMAVVTGVEQRKERGIHTSRIVYDVDYEYSTYSTAYTYGATYTGRLVGSATFREVGDHFDIKCDPDAPELSTDILEPRKNVLIANLAGAAAFTFIGLIAMGWRPFRKRKQAKRKK